MEVGSHQGWEGGAALAGTECWNKLLGLLLELLLELLPGSQQAHEAGGES